MDIEVVEEESKPKWQEEGFDSYEDYEAYYVKLVDDLESESKERYTKHKREWFKADQRVELDNLFDQVIDRSPVRSPLPILQQAVEEAIAVMVESLPRPQAVSRQATQDDFAGALNAFMEEELDANQFDLLMAKIALDIKKFNLGVVEQTISPDENGPFGNPGRIVLKRVDPRYIWPDALAASWRWEDMRYLVVSEPHDLSSIRRWFPVRGALVLPESTYSLTREDALDDELAGVMDSPFKKSGGGFKIGQRERAVLKKCWLRDEHTEEAPMLNEETGEPLYDENGECVMERVMAYPEGRLIITANGRLLADIANPFRHKQPPYTFFQGRVSGRLMTHGDVQLLARIEDKINLLHKDLMRNARVNIRAPWVLDSTAFDSPEKFRRISNEPEELIIVRPNARVERLPPGELPQFIFPLINWLKGVFDDVLGVQSIMRGNIEQGAQLSAEAIQALQGAGSARVRLKSRLFEQGLEHLGHLLQWNIRQTYPTEFTAQVIDPSTQQPKEIKWDSSKAQADYAIAVEAGSSMPGAKQSGSQMMLTLYKEGVVDRQAVLAGSGIPNAGAIDERMTKEERRKEQLQLLGAKFKQGGSNKSGAQGRRELSPKI